MDPRWIPTTRPGLDPQPAVPETPEEKLRAAFAMHAAALDLLRQALRRRQPEISEERVEEQVVRWLRTRPGAEFGDGPGIPREL